MQTFLVVTRPSAPEAVKAAIDAAAPLAGGVGITASGGVAAFTDYGTKPLEFRGDDLATIWPTDEAAPHAWIIATEDDDGLYTVSHGLNVPLTPSDLDQRLLIDGVLHSIGVVQVPGDRPASILRVGGTRRDPVIDASRRSVEIPSAAKTRVARATPSAETIEFGDAVSRNLRAKIVVWNGRRWGNLTVGKLLAGIYSETDLDARYVALKAGLPTVPPTFSIAEIEAGARLVGLATGIAFKDIPVPATGEGLFTAVAVPVNDPFEFYGHERFPSRNKRTSLSRTPSDSITLTSGEEVDVYISSRALVPSVFAPGWYAYFDSDSVNP